VHLHAALGIRQEVELIRANVFYSAFLSVFYFVYVFMFLTFFIFLERFYMYELQ